MSKKKKQKKGRVAEDSYFDQGFQHHKNGRFNEAVKCYLLALNQQPSNANVYSNLSDALSKQGLHEQAEACCRQAITLQPDLAHAHANLANALKAQGKFEQSRLSYLAALRIKPDWAEVYNNLALTLRDLGYLTDAADCLRKALALIPDWPSAHDSLLFCLSHDVQLDPQQLLAAHLDFARQFELPLSAHLQTHTNAKDPERGLNIGFVSGDLYHHALAGYFEPLFKFLAAKPALTLHVYYTNTVEDSVTQRLKSYFAHWQVVDYLSAGQLANKIRADGIDILIDLSGHTTHNRLLTFARKPAPIQASWLGYLGTSGLRSMDYYICDRYWIPPGELDWQFTEKPAYLPAAVVFEPNEYAPPVGALPALANGYLTFGSFNRSNKINASVVMLWAMLLRSLPTARMLIGAIPEESQKRLVQDFAAEGIDPGRLEFQPRLVMLDYLASHERVDVCLDTFPFGGGVTTLHAAWMGVPTLSLAGETPASRFGAAEMHILGLDDFIATSIEDFVDKGRYWAGHVTELAAIRTNLRARFAASPMGQPAEFADAFEAMLRGMWRGWCDGAVGNDMSFQGRNPLASNASTDITSVGTSMPPLVVVSATQRAEADFWANSALGLSLKRLRQQGEEIRLDIAFENARGLPELFNAAIARAQSADILVFVHDDVWIDEYNFSQSVVTGLQQFDVIGVAGNKRRLPRQPAWSFVDTAFTWDDKSQLSGEVGHGAEAFGIPTYFGDVPAACELLDGVFLAVCKGRLDSRQVGFDPRFKFHFYDLDFCRSARQAGLTLGTWPVHLTHQSTGGFSSASWRAGYKHYLNKWEKPDKDRRPLGDSPRTGSTGTANRSLAQHNTQDTAKTQTTMNAYTYNQADNYYQSKIQSEFSYVDASNAESRIYEIIKSASDRSVFSEELVNQASDWPSFYHLTPMRANILRPFAEEIASGRTLELGAGCGAITRFIGELGGEVVALEGSPARARIIGKRCEDLKNVTVLADLIQNFSPDEKFDVVTLIGVLEYAQVYVDQPDPVDFLLRHAKSLLKEDGLLLIAIENQLGLKYLCGSPEDHLGYPMFGINDSYTRKSAITFGRKELTGRITQAGFSVVDLLVPVPDYKTPVSIIYPEGFAAESQAAGWDVSPLLSGSVVHDRQRPGLPTFSLENAWGVVGRNGLAQDLANSFLFAARMTEVAKDRKILAAHYGCQRPAQFAKETRFLLDDGAVTTQTRQVGDTRALASSAWDFGPYHCGKLWFDELLLVINRPGWKLADISQWAGIWIDALGQVPAPAPESTIPELRHFSALLPANYIDATPTNFILKNSGTGHFFDLEWNFSIALPLEFVVLRGLFLTFHRVTSCMAPAADVPLKLFDITTELMKQHAMSLSEEDLQLFIAIFNAFQNQTQNVSANVLNGLTAQIETAVLPIRQLFGGSRAGTSATSA